MADTLADLTRATGGFSVYRYYFGSVRWLHLVVFTGSILGLEYVCTLLTIPRPEANISRLVHVGCIRRVGSYRLVLHGDHFAVPHRDHRRPPARISPHFSPATPLGHRG